MQIKNMSYGHVKYILSTFSVLEKDMGIRVYLDKKYFKIKSIGIGSTRHNYFDMTANDIIRYCDLFNANDDFVVFLDDDNYPNSIKIDSVEINNINRYYTADNGDVLISRNISFVLIASSN